MNVTRTLTVDVNVAGIGHEFATQEEADEFIATVCSRCERISSDRWEEGWPNYGRIELGFAAQIFGALRGRPYAAESGDWDVVKQHRAVTRNDAQHVTFEWGNGVEFDSRGRYRLCRMCQRELIALIGLFFGMRAA